MNEQHMLYVCARDRNTKYIQSLAYILVLQSKRAATVLTVDAMVISSEWSWEGSWTAGGIELGAIDGMPS